MINKSRRILWLLNHKTLMRYEIPLLQSLGFEVFTPKIIPNNVATFRSGAVDYSADSGLSIPDDVLNALNSFDFYSKNWSQDISLHVNKYFGAVFTMPLKYPFQEVITKYHGQIILRAFGLQHDYSYDKVLRLECGDQVESWLAGVKDRFWFGKGYEYLDECETPLLKDRSVLLPLGLDHGYWKNENTWLGTDKQILFICPNINDNYYYANIYRKFKEDFGDLPHVIVGQQGTPVDDPHVRGFVSDDELNELYKKSSLLYYHSHEPRHVHYSPVEAAIIGTPIVFYKDSLLGRILKKDILGSTQNTMEARALIERLLLGDNELQTRLSSEQGNIPFYFSNQYCEPIWRENILSGPFSSALVNSINHEGIIESSTINKGDGTTLCPIQYNNEMKWFDSIKFPDGRIMPGVVPYEIFKARADIIFEDLKPGETVLDIGDGDGFYAFESELRGAGKTTCVINGDSNCFLYARQELSSHVELRTEIQFETAGSSYRTYDWVFLRGIINQTRNPFHLLERMTKFTNKGLVIELLMDLQDLKRPAMVYYGDENRLGYPVDGFGFNFLFIESALNKLGFKEVSYRPTPDAPSIRGIIIAFK